MRKTISILAAAAAALTSTIGFAAEGQQKFVHDGQTYVYTATAATGNRQVIEGHRYPSGQAFRLIVRGDRVSGFSGGVPVAFKIAEARGSAAGLQLASR